MASGLMLYAVPVAVPLLTVFLSRQPVPDNTCS